MLTRINSFQHPKLRMRNYKAGVATATRKKYAKMFGELKKSAYLCTR